MAEERMLTEIEDETLAASEGDYVDIPVILKVLRSWHRRAIASKTIDRAFHRLVELGLVKVYTYSRRTRRYTRVESSRPNSKKLYYRASRNGEEYLARTKLGT